MTPSFLRATLAILTISTAPHLALAEGLPTAPQPAPPRLEVVFVLDTTGSMDSLIDGAKQKIWSIANTMIDLNAEAEIAFGLIGYRDLEDEYVTRVHALTDDVQGIFTKLRRFEANGGGDTPEAVNEALSAAVTKIDWGNEANGTRIIFLVGDAPPHMDYPNGPKFDAVLKKAREKGIIVNTVQAGEDHETEAYWRKIADLGKGSYMAIPQDGGQIRQIPTPMDDQIILIQDKIDATIIPYGTQSEVSDLKAKVSDRKAASRSVQADNSSFYAKKGGKKEAVTGGNDLVTDLANGDVDLDKLSDDLLAPELKAMSAEDRKAYLDQQLVIRQQLEAEMAEAVQARDGYLEAEAAKVAAKPAAPSFDSSVKEVLKMQISPSKP